MFAIPVFPDISRKFKRNMNSLELILNVKKGLQKIWDICYDQNHQKKKKGHLKSVKKTIKLLGWYIQIDVILTYGGNKYFIPFINDFTNYTHIYLLKNIKYFLKVENQFDRKIKRVRSDRSW